MAVSGWGGATEWINDALDRKKREQEEEERKREEARNRSLQERNQVVNPWQPPVIAPVQPDPLLSSPYSSPPLDTSAPSVGSSRNDSPTVQSRLPQPQMQPSATIAPRPMLPSLSDRLRDPYSSQVNNSRLPDEQPQQYPQQRTDMFRWPDDGTTPEQRTNRVSQSNTYQQPRAQPQPYVGTSDRVRGEYNDPNRPMVPTEARPYGSEPTYPKPFNPIESLVNAYANSPEYQYAQQKSADRRGWEVPSFQELVDERMGGTDFAPAPLDYGMAAITKGLNEFDPTREAIMRGGDVMDRLTASGQWALNTPIPGMGTSLSEFYSPMIDELTNSLNPFDPDYKGNANALLTIGQLVLNGDSFLRGIGMSQLENTKAARAEVNKAIADTGNPQLALALRNISGREGADRVRATLDLLQNRDQIAESLHQQAVDAQYTDPVKASQLFAQEQQLRGMSYAEMVDANMDPLTEIIYGVVADPTDLMLAPIFHAFGLVKELRVAKQANRLVNMADGVGLARLLEVPKQGERLVNALTEGNKAARQVYNDIIFPQMGVGEKLTATDWTRWMLINATPGAKAALDTRILSENLVGVFGGLVRKDDALKVMDTLINSPADLVKGIGNLSPEAMARYGGADGLVRWGDGLVANKELVRRLSLLKTAEADLKGMKSLAEQGNVNRVAFQAELNEVLQGAALRVSGGRVPTTLPFGASKVEVETLGPNTARLVYKDSKGKVIRGGIETTATEAQRQLLNVQEDINPRFRKRDVPMGALRAVANAQRYIMNDVWLFARPANWIGNALSASVGLYAHDAYGLDSVPQILEWTGQKYGGFAPTSRLANTIPGMGDLTRTARDEVGGSALGWLAAKATGKTDNGVTKLMKGLQEIPYGATEIPLPGGGAVPVGEEALAARAFYYPAKRAFEREIVTNTRTTLLPKLMQGEGMTPELAKNVQEMVISAAKRGGKGDIVPEIMSRLGKPKITRTLEQLGTPPELLSTKGAAEIERILMDADPSEIKEVRQRIASVFAEERRGPANALILDSGEPRIDFTDADMTTEAGWVAQQFVDDAVKAGIDPATAKAQAEELATGYIKEQQEAWTRLVEDAAMGPTRPEAWDALVDFYLDYMKAKNVARETVNEAGRVARELNTPEAWAAKWQTTKSTYDDLRKELGKLSEQARLDLQSVYNGGAYQARNNWFDTIEQYALWDEQEFRDARALNLGGVEDDASLWEKVIRANRQFLDNAQYEAVGAFQKYPSLENFDLIRSGMRQIEIMGAKTAHEMALLRQQRAAGEIGATEYNRLRNAKWNKFFDDSVTLHEIMGKVIVRNGITRDTLTQLKWVEGDATYELLGPSATPGKWRARNVKTGAVGEEFTVGSAKEGANPFAVPKEVVDDYNRLAGNDIELDKAADAVLEEIAQAVPVAPHPAPAVETLPEQTTQVTRPLPDEPWQGPMPAYPNAGIDEEKLFGATSEKVAPPSTQDYPRPAYKNAGITEAQLWGDEPVLPSRPKVAGGLAGDARPQRPFTSEPWQGPEVVYPRPAYPNAGMSEEQLWGATSEEAAITSKQDYPRPPYKNAGLGNLWPDEPVLPSRPKVPGGLAGDVRDLPTTSTPKEAARAERDALAAQLEQEVTPVAPAPEVAPVTESATKPLDQRMTKKQLLAEYGDQLRAQGMTDAQLSKMSKAEIAKAIETKPTVTPPSPVGTGNAPSTLSDYGQGQRVQDSSAAPELAVTFGKPTEYNKRNGIEVKVEWVNRKGDTVDERLYVVASRSKNGTYYVESRTSGATYLDKVMAPESSGAKTTVLERELTLSEAKQFAKDYLLNTYRREAGLGGRGFGQGVRVDSAGVGKETLPLATGKPPKKVPDAVFGKPFDRMSSKEIVDEYGWELESPYFTKKDIAELAKNREDLIQAIAEVRKVDVSTLDSMKRYDSTVPSISSVLGAKDKADGVKVWQRLFESGKRSGTNRVPTQANKAAVQIENLNDLERTLNARLPQILAGEPNTLTGAQRLRVIDAVRDWLPEYDNVATKARMVGQQMADHIMLNVDNKRDFDSLLSVLMNYSYFWSRMPSRIVSAAVAKPGLVNFFYQTNRALALENEQAGLPARFDGTVQGPGNSRINIASLLRYAMGGATQYLEANPFVEDDPTDNAAEKIAKQVSKYTPGLFNTWWAVLDGLDGKMDKDYSNVLNNSIRVPLVGAQPSSVYQALTGDMPAAGNPWNLGFGPDKFDVGRARRAISTIAVENKTPDVVARAAQQVLLNQSQGKPVEYNVDPKYLQAAITLAENGVKRAAQDRLAANISSYTTGMAVTAAPQAELDMLKAQEGYFASGYDPANNPDGSKALQGNIMDKVPELGAWWSKSSDTPGIDGQISALYDEANATGEWDRIMPQIEALQAQKAEIAGEQPRPMMQPTPASVSDVLRGSYGDANKGMNPQEQKDKQQKEAAQVYWDEYTALSKDDDSRAEYLRNNPEFVAIYDANEKAKGREVNHWWEKGTSTGKGAAAVGSVTLEPGSVTRDSFTEQQLDQYYGEYLDFNGTKDWDGQKAWLLEHPDFARMEADRKFAKDGEYPWWYDDVFGEQGRGAASLQRPPSQPSSTADVLRRPYDVPGTGDNVGATQRGTGAAVGGNAFSVNWDEYKALGDDNDAKRKYMLDHPDFARYYVDRYGEDSAWWLGEGGDWSLNWDEYTAFGDDYAAKRQYMLDHPEFAKYYKERYGNAWWESGGTGGGRAYGGGGGGGGSPWLGGGGGGGGYAPRVDPRYMDRGLWDGPNQQRPWIPYSNPTPDWLRTGDRVQADPLRKWIPPRWS